MPVFTQYELSPVGSGDIKQMTIALTMDKERPNTKKFQGHFKYAPVHKEFYFRCSIVGPKVIVYDAYAAEECEISHWLGGGQLPLSIDDSSPQESEFLLPENYGKVQVTMEWLDAKTAHVTLGF